MNLPHENSHLLGLPVLRCNLRRFVAVDEVQKYRVSQARDIAISIVVAVALATVGVLLVGKPSGVVIGAPVLIYAVAKAFGADKARSVALYFALAVTWAIAGVLLMGELLGAIIGAPVLVAAIFRAFGIDDPSDFL